MATMLARVVVHPGREAEFEAVAAELWRRTHADEAGVARYEYWRGGEPGTYYTLGSFDGYDGFIAHQTSRHHLDATPALRSLIAELHIEWVDAVDEANGLPSTDSSPTPADADDVERDFRTRHAVTVPAWWRTLRRPPQ